MNKSDTSVGQPWWKFGHVWLVIAGPAVVVVAGFITLYLAVRSPNPIVTESDFRQDAAVSPTAGAASINLAPALQARNHAATGALPAVKPASKP